MGMPRGRKSESTSSDRAIAAEKAKDEVLVTEDEERDDDTDAFDTLEDEGEARAIRDIAGEEVSHSQGEESALVVAAVVEDESEPPLSAEEEDRLFTLEREVEESALRAAVALKEIRDSRLYRMTHGTFEEYCKERFGFVRSYSYQLIDAAITSDNIRKCLRDADILPANEYQLRPLSKLKDNPEIQAKVWERSVEKAKGRQPTYDAVKEALLEVEGAGAPGREDEPKPYVFKKDDVCVIREADDPILKDRRGYWAIIDDVSDDGTVTLSIYDRTAIGNVKASTLLPLPLKAKEKRDRGKLLSRLHAIDEGLGDDDRMVRHLMPYFGRLKATNLTMVEDDVLRVLERRAKAAQAQGDEGEDEEVEAATPGS